MKNTPYIAFAVFERMFSKNNRNVDIAYSYCKNYFKISFAFLSFRNWLLHRQKHILSVLYSKNKQGQA